MAASLLYRPGDQAHAVLRGYKDAGSPAARRHFARRLAEGLDWFLAVHGPCLRTRTGPVDALCPVPSTRPRPGAPGHPLATVLAGVAGARGLPSVTLQPGPTPAHHLQASSTAFVAPRLDDGCRVLVVDDTWTTGAHALSAAAALRAAGAAVVGILVVGRCVDPGASPAVGAWWRRASAASLAPSSFMPAPGVGGAPPAGCRQPRCPARGRAGGT